LPRPLGAGRCDTDGDCAADEDCTGITTPLGGTSRVCRPNKGHDAGVAMGDMLLFGGNLSIFVPGPGKDSDSDFHRLFGSGVDTLGSPLPFDAVYALGKGVSYGYSAPQGKVLVPIFGGSFSFGATAAASCTHGDKGCLAGKLIRSERWVSVGFGDAASALEPLERARGSAVGTLKGVVMRAGSGSPVDDGEVYALKDPRDLECDGACEKRCGDAPSGDALKTMSLDEVMAANKCRSVDATFLEGTAGAVTMAKVDAGVRPTVTGRYQMTVPTGRYVLVATDSLSSVSKVVPVTVEANKTREVAFVLPRLGKLAYSLFDGHAKPVAGRVIVGQCLPENPCVDDDECREGTTCQQGSCACERSRFKPLELGGARFADGVVAFDQTANGTGVLDLPPGKYDVVFSHGPQHTVDRKRVTIEASTTTSLRGDVFRAVDRSGWSSSDFHVHADPSLDSDTPLTERVTSYLAEDMDFMSSSDHDVLTDYEPLLEQMKVRDRLSTQVGVEVSTQEIGHFIGWPLRYQQWDDGKRVDGNGAFDWRGLVPQEIMDSLRKLRDDRPVVVEVPHPYSYFDYYSLDPVSLEPTDTLLSTINPLLSAVSFSGDFDAMEILNGKNADYFRRPTVGELRFFSQGLDALNKEREAGELDEEEYERRRFLLSVEGVRRILHRTPEEQQAAIA
ncbi:MAG: hypothetical protein KC417_16000, partial [Myxococcales bacterium]|nr:hypothetical protein [Myxococcales bacterium]